MEQYSSQKNGQKLPHSQILTVVNTYLFFYFLRHSWTHHNSTQCLFEDYGKIGIFFLIINLYLKKKDYRTKIVRTIPQTTMKEQCAAAAAEGGTPIWVVVILCICSFPAVFWIVFYTLPQLYMTFRSVPNLKEKYGAKWSLVTGGGSGIGKALVFKLARQGLNVVVVSLDDDILKATIKQLKEQFPDLQFRSIGVSFSPGVEYMKKIRESTDDIEIPIIFNNAGFLVTGFFDQAPIGKLLANMECTYIYVCYYLFIWMFVIYLL